MYNFKTIVAPFILNSIFNLKSIFSNKKISTFTHFHAILIFTPNIAQFNVYNMFLCKPSITIFLEDII